MRLTDSSIEWEWQAASLGATKPDLRWAGQLIGIASGLLTAWCVWTLVSFIAGSL